MSDLPEGFSPLPPQSFWDALPVDRPPGTAYACPGCGAWCWAVALGREATADDRVCPRGDPDCADCARVTVVVVYAHTCPGCGHEWSHRARF